MQTILTSISKILVIPLVGVLSLAGYSLTPTNQIENYVPAIASLQQQVSDLGGQVRLGAYNPTGGATYRLQSSIGTTDTTIKLSSFKEPVSQIPYTMSYLNTSVAYGTLDPQQPTRSEFISFTGITQNADGTATLTGVSRGMSRSYPYTASTTLRQTHSGQSIFILSDSPQHFAEYAVKQNDETITGDWKVPTPANATSIVNRNYVDGVAFGGIGGASETATGTVEIATGLEIASSTTNGTLGRLAIPASLATSTYNSATAGLKVIVTQNDGKIDSNFLPSNIVTTSGNNTFTGVNTFSTTTATSTMIGSMPAWEIGKQYAFYSTAGTYTFVPPSGVSKVVVHVVGGGGNGGGYSGAGGQSAGGGGGAGGHCFNIVDVTATTSVQIIVGGQGSVSRFSTYCIANGGTIGDSATAASGAGGGPGGTSSGGIINAEGSAGSVGTTGSITGGGTGGSSFFSGGADGGNNGIYGAGGGGSAGSSGGQTQSQGIGGAGAILITW